MVTGPDYDTARIWDAATGKQILRFDGHERYVWTAGFSPDNLRVVTGSDAYYRPDLECQNRQGDPTAGQA